MDYFNHVITEINVCAKLEEHWSNIVILEQGYTY